MGVRDCTLRGQLIHKVLNKSVGNVPPPGTDPLTLHHQVELDFPPARRDNLPNVLTRNPGQQGDVKMADQGLTEKEPGRRQSARYKTNVPATLTTDKSESQIDIIQISRDGCLVFPPIPQLTDPNVDLTFQLGEGLAYFRTACQIIYTIHNLGSGISFSGLSEMERDAIDRFISG